MIGKVILYITVLFGVASLALPAFAQGSYRSFDTDACERAVIDKLVEHGAKEDDIKSMNFVLQHSGSRSGKVNMIGIEYWVELGSSDGRAVVELTEKG